MSASRSHRKRHVPPGPVGVWFLSQQQQLQSNNAGSDKKSNYAQRSSSENSRSNSSHSNKSNNSKRNRDNSFLPLWSTVQEDLNLDTPYLSSWNGDLKQKYEELRPYLPREFILLREVLHGDYDFTIPAGFHLLLLVNAIESHNLHSICTVELHDETGLSVRAWVEPRFVQEQMQKQQDSSVMRTGVIWMLKEVGVMVQMNEDDEEIERILLIGMKHIERVWTPENVKDVDFLQHMERKKAISQHISKVDDEIEELQGSSVEEYVHQIDENGDQENRCRYETPGDGLTCTITQNDLPCHLKKENGKNSQGTDTSCLLPLIQIDQSTSQHTGCNTLRNNTTNCPNRPIEENPVASKQHSKNRSRQKSPTGTHHDNGEKRRNFALGVHPGGIIMDTKCSVAEARRNQRILLPERSVLSKGGKFLPVSSPAGCLWDNLKGDATLQIFDENDDDTNDENNFAARQSLQVHTQPLSTEASKHHEENHTPNKQRIDIIELEKKGEIKSRSAICPSLSQQDQTGSAQSSSIFESSNLAGIDLSAFDDDES